jgi:aminomethyltransferase
MGQLVLSGSTAVEVADDLLTNHVGRLSDGQGLYSCCCNEAGGVLDDVIAYRHGAEQILVVCNAANRAKMADHFAQVARGRCDFRDVSDETSLLALQGPHAFDVLSGVRCSVNQAMLGRFRCSSASVAGIPCTVARTGYTGEDGVEIFCSPRDVAALWVALREAGAEPTGLGARDTLRLEAALPLYGNELTESTHPLEAGLRWTVKWDKPTFIGKQALLDAATRGLVRRLVGFEMVGRGIARHGYPLLDSGGQIVGHCTSGAPSPTLAKAIGLGYLPVNLANVGQSIGVDCRGKVIEATICATPFYRRSRTE